MAVIGIDLGTTHSVAAVARGGEAGQVIRIANGLVPSVTTIHQGEWIVGQDALDRGVGQPIHSIKRLMGRSYDETIPLPGRSSRRRLLRDLVKSRWGYEVVPIEGGQGLKVRVGEGSYTPVEISARILMRVAEESRSKLREDIEGVVVTVPAYFEERQIAATREAAALAGLRVLDILNEPAATALVYARRELPLEPRTVLVYDLGGGTFDVTVGEIEGPNFLPLEVDGNCLLGGDDFDQRVIEFVDTMLSEDLRQRVAKDPWLQGQLLMRARSAKERLTEEPEAAVLLGDLLEGAPAQVPLRRSEFEAWIDPLIEETLYLSQRALNASGRSISDVDAVLLAGGSTHVPRVREALADVFGHDRLMAGVDVMHTVAIGAAEYAVRVGPGAIVCPWPQCGQSNADGEENCAACGRELPTVEGVAITERPYGIQVKDRDGVEVADWGIPKGEFLSTIEPAKRKYHVPSARFLKLKFLQGVKDSVGEYRREAESHSPQAVLWTRMEPGEHTVQVQYGLSAEGLSDVVVMCDGEVLRSIGLLRASDEWGSNLEVSVDALDDAFRRRKPGDKCSTCQQQLRQFEKQLQRTSSVFEIEEPAARRDAALGLLEALDGLAAEVEAHSHGEEKVGAMRSKGADPELGFMARLHEEWRTYFLSQPAREAVECGKCRTANIPGLELQSTCEECGATLHLDLWHENDTLFRELKSRKRQSKGEDLDVEVLSQRLRGRILGDPLLTLILQMEMAAHALSAGLRSAGGAQTPAPTGLVATPQKESGTRAVGHDPWPWFQSVLRDCGVDRKYCEKKLGARGLRFTREGDLASPSDVRTLGELLAAGFNQLKLRLDTQDSDGARGVFEQYLPLVRAGRSLAGIG
jgi:actin-like ATPase involved in cell morphogenesis